MKIEELKKAKDRRPFQPFLIRMADGREIEVRHPDAIAWGDKRIVSYVSPADDWLLMAIKNARQKERRHANNGG